MWCFNEGIGWWSSFGGIWMFLIWGGFMALITGGVIMLSRKNRPTSDDSALDIVKGR